MIKLIKKIFDEILFYSKEKDIFYVLTHNTHDRQLNLSKEKILQLLQKNEQLLIDGTKSIASKKSIIDLIVEFNKEENLGFNKEDIVNLIKKYPKFLFNYNEPEINIISYVCNFNIKEDLGFNKKDTNEILNINPKLLKNSFKYIINKNNGLDYSSNEIVEIIEKNKEIIFNINKKTLIDIFQNFFLNDSNYFSFEQTNFYYTEILVKLNLKNETQELLNSYKNYKNFLIKKDAVEEKKLLNDILNVENIIPMNKEEKKFKNKI